MEIQFLSLTQKANLYDSLKNGSEDAKNDATKSIFDEIGRLESVIKHHENIFDYIKQNKENLSKSFTKPK